MNPNDLLLANDDSSRLPELSFEDFLDNSPRNQSESDNESLEFDDDDDYTNNEDTLNTPGPKPKLNTDNSRLNPTKLEVWEKETTGLKDIFDDIDESYMESELMDSKIPIVKTKTATTDDEYTVASASKPEPNKGVRVVVTSKGFPTKLLSSGTTTNTKTNLENFFAKGNNLTTSKASTSSTAIKRLVRIAPKLITVGNTTAAPTITSKNIIANNAVGTNLNTSGSTAVQTPGGKVFYIQNAQAGALPVVRLQTKSAAAIVSAQSSLATSTLTTSATKVSSKMLTPTSGGTSISNNNKTLTVQVVRTADGKLVPIKQNKPSSSTTTTTTTTTTTEIATNSGTKTIIPTTSKIISGPKLSISAKDLVNKKIITSNNSSQFILKGSIKSNATTTTPILSSTTINKNNSNIKKPIQIVGVSKSTTAITTPSGVLLKTKSAITTAPTLTTTTTTTTATTKQEMPTIKILATSKPTNISTAVATATTTTATTIGGNKFFVQNSGGKQIVISNQHIIKLAGKPTISQTSATTTATTTTSGNSISNMGKLKAVQITGKPGIQYVRVLPAASKIATLKSTTTTTTTTTTPSTIKTILVCHASTGTTTTTTPASSSSSSLKSSPAQKITIIRQPMTSGSKVLLTKSTINLPTSQNKVAIVANHSSTGNKSLVKQTPILTTTAGTVTGKNIINPCKPKVNDFNADFKRFANTLTVGLEPESKKIRAVSRGVVPPNRHRPLNSYDTKDNDKTFTLYPRSQKLFGSTLATMNIETVCNDDKEKEFQRVKQQLQQQSLAKSQKGRSNKNRDEELDIRESGPIIDASTSTVLVRRKHCNCSKSQCMKLYCDCFANGEFCQDCTCRDCKNNLENEDERQKAIKICLERNPTAFQPKITTCTEGVVAVADASMRHNKGCNCKRSSCLKNYCECYEAKIPCSSNCKCVGCRNVEDRLDLNMDPIDPSIMATIKGKPASALKAGQKRNYSKRGESSKPSDDIEQPTTSKRAAMDAASTGAGLGNGVDISDTDARQSSADKPNFITSEVIAATVQCMVSQADQCDRTGLEELLIERMIIEEMGRCLVEIIDFSIRNTNTSFSQD